MPRPYRGFCFFPSFLYCNEKPETAELLMPSFPWQRLQLSPSCLFPSSSLCWNLSTCPDPAVAVATTVKSPKVSSLKSGLWDKSNRSTSTPRGELFPDVLLVWKKLFNYSREAQLWFSLEGLGKIVTRHLCLFKILGQ